MKTYVTFGQVHVHNVDGITLDSNCVAVLNATDAIAGRALAFELFGDEFFTTYCEDRFDRSSLKYFPRGLIYL